MVVVGDRVDESDESVVLRLENPVNGVFAGNLLTLDGSGTIVDNDVTITPPLEEIYEGEIQTFVVSGIDGGYTKLNLSDGSGTVATEGVDFRLLGPDDQVLGTNQNLNVTNGSVTFKVDALADNVATEGDESIVLVLDDSTNSLAAGLGTLIIKNGSRPRAGVDISPLELSLTEGGSTGSYQVMLTKAPDADETVTLIATSGTSALVGLSSGDGTPGAKLELEFDDKNWDSPQTVQLTPYRDSDAVDAVVTITNTIQSTGSYANVTAASVVVSISDLGVGLSVFDSEATEGGYLSFVIALSEPAPSAVTVDYETVPRTAEPNVDYEDSSGSIQFSEGEQEKIVQILSIADNVKEPDEDFEITLSNSQNADLVNQAAIGTIIDATLATRAWKPRIGRTVTEHVMSAIETRLKADRSAGVDATVAGVQLPNSTQVLKFEDATSSCQNNIKIRVQGGLSTPYDRDCSGSNNEESSMNWDEELAKTYISMTDNYNQGEHSSFWAGGAQSSIEGQDESLSLSGEVTTGMIGADWSSGDWLLGFLISNSKSEGNYSLEEGGSGVISSSLSAVVPWVSNEIAEDLSYWGATGLGSGKFTVSPENGPAASTDIKWSMVAAGLRGTLLKKQSAHEFQLDITSDVFWTRTSSDQSEFLQVEPTTVSQLRVGFEGGWKIDLDGETTLKPDLELGVRYDHGDAETGLGIDAGGSIVWSNPKSGFDLSLKGRTLISHKDKNYRDTGFSVSLDYDSSPSRRRGFQMTIAQEWGGESAGSIDSLFADPVSNTGGENQSDVSSWRIDLAYEHELPGSFIGKPYTSFLKSETQREISVGWQLLSPSKSDTKISHNIKATRTNSIGGDISHQIGLEIGVRW